MFIKYALNCALYYSLRSLHDKSVSETTRKTDPPSHHFEKLPNGAISSAKQIDESLELRQMYGIKDRLPRDGMEITPLQ